MRTPCLRSETLSRIAKADVWLKFENLQFTASFKERGALTRCCSSRPRSAKRGVIAMSAGNHAQGVAYHARPPGHPGDHRDAARHAHHEGRRTRAATAPRWCCTATAGRGRGRSASPGAAEHELVFVHPYDDPRIIAGQGTMALEMLEDVPQLDTLVVPVGGGGLIAGCAVAARGLKPDIKVIGVEPRGLPGDAPAPGAASR